MIPGMLFFADLHTHSHFSRATSRDLDPENLAVWAQKKGISVIGSGDFTHPGWISELQEKLVEADNGLYRLRPDLEEAILKEIPKACHGPVRFILTGEISCIYKRDERTRKAHHLILMPDFESVQRLNKRLHRIGNIVSDGRPILGLDSRDLLEIVLETSDRAFFIPAHIWTPWFSVFGSKSGFNSLEECFGNLVSHIRALETGLSSDPPMNRLLTALDQYILVSNSDAHSPSKLGREANIFDTDLDYDHMVRAMTEGDGFEGTIEFYPEEGKYHLDGHRKCRVQLYPQETRQHKGICPSCGKPLTVGVLHRVAELADRSKPELSKDFFSLIPLTEIFSEILACGSATKRVVSAYDDLLTDLGPELRILMDLPLNEIEKAGGHLLATAIDRMRRNHVIKQGGYDGEYGIIRLFHESEIAELSGQQSLFGRPEKETVDSREAFIHTKPLKESMQTQGGQQEKTLADPILDPLNAAQKEAVCHMGSHLLIVAGPGTGKTMTLTHRIAYMIRSGSVSPDQILALTFTNKAAGEMRKRIHALISKQMSEEITVATFHGFCLEVLREHEALLNLPSDFNLCSELDAPILVREAVLESGKGKRFAALLIRDLPLMKMHEAMGDDKSRFQSDLMPILQRYQKRLRELGLLDLNDLEVETFRLFRDHPDVCRIYAKRFPRIFVDEYQDTNPLQAALLRKVIHSGTGEICAIGDPDQAIYGFRGADVANFFRFREDFPGAREIMLNKNYRSTQVILNGSSGLLGKEEPLEGIRGRGDLIRFGSCGTQGEEAEMVVEQIEKLMGGTSYFSLDSGRVSSHENGEELSFGDIAVLFRLNVQGNDFQEAFTRAGIPFIRSGEKSLVDRYPVNIIWRFLQALHYPQNRYYRDAYLDLLGDDAQNGEKIFNTTEKGKVLTELIDRTVTVHGFDMTTDESVEAVRRLRELATDFEDDLESLLDVLSLDRGIDHTALRGDRVALMSLHAAKGLEWPVVFITGCEDKVIPCLLFENRDDDEEKRLFYVGMTRACKILILSYASHRRINGRLIHMGPSPFVGLIPKDLCRPLERARWKRKRKAQEQMELFRT